jgi:hypothetical protein
LKIGTSTCCINHLWFCCFAIQENNVFSTCVLIHIIFFFFIISSFICVFLVKWNIYIYIKIIYKCPFLSLCKKKINIDYFCHLCWKCTFLSPFDKHILRVTILIQYNIFGLKYCNQWSSIFDMYMWYLLLTL